jgi:hypothetical protein
VSDLTAQLQAGHLSEDTVFQLLAKADNLSAQGDWTDAWQALEAVEQAAKQIGHALYLAEAAMQRRSAGSSRCVASSIATMSG